MDTVNCVAIKILSLKIGCGRFLKWGYREPAERVLGGGDECLSK